MSFVFRASESTTIFERRVFSIFDIAAVLGGLFKSLTIAGFLICAAFSYYLFIASLIR